MKLNYVLRQTGEKIVSSFIFYYLCLKNDSILTNLYKADLDGTIFAYDYRARLACIMTLRQIAGRVN